MVLFEVTLIKYCTIFAVTVAVVVCLCLLIVTEELSVFLMADFPPAGAGVLVWRASLACGLILQPARDTVRVGGLSRSPEKLL